MTVLGYKLKLCRSLGLAFSAHFQFHAFFPSQDIKCVIEFLFRQLMMS